MRFVLILALINSCYLADGKISYNLVNGKNPTQGRLQITYNGVPGSVCGGDSFKEPEARVVCKSMGYRGGTVRPRAVPYGQGKGTIWLSKVDCTGTEAELTDCKHEKWGEKGKCTHMDDVGIECTAKQTHGMYRLSDESFGIGAGVVEVFYNGKWGNICYDDDTGFSKENAKVVCKSIGYEGNRPGEPVGWGIATLEFVWKDVACTGDEDYLHECEFKETNRYCGYRSPQVLCDVPFRFTESEGMWKFVDGPSPVNGRVMAWDDGIWGSVCDSNFDDVDASILCRSFNFRSGKKSVKNYPGEGLIKYTDIQCGGAEPSLKQCSKSTNTSSCTHAQDVAVTCDVKNKHVKLRLAQGGSRYSGRLEVSLLDEWGTVSGKEFGTAEAEVVCRYLKLKGGSAMHAILGNPVYGRGTGRVWMHGVKCTGKEKHLNECKFPGWGIEEPSHGRDVSVHCLPSGSIKEEYKLSYRLADGPNKFEGRLEVENSILKYYGWGTVCSNMFSEKTARVICRDLNFIGGKVIAERRPGTGPILLDNIVCTGTETTLKDCKLTWGESQCTHEQDVYIRCTDPEVKKLTPNQKYIRRNLKMAIDQKILIYVKMFKKMYEATSPPKGDEVLLKATAFVKASEVCADRKSDRQTSCAFSYYEYEKTFGEDGGELCEGNFNTPFQEQCCKTCENLKKGIKPKKPTEE